MCGVAGITYLGSQSCVSEEETKILLERAGDAIRHRGPDDHGVWLNHDGRVGFAHRRLSILDLSARGHQPMVDSFGNALTFNGEIYNFRTLRASLRQKEFRSESDTEVVLHGLREQGTGFLSKLDGMFALGYYSNASQQLILAVDPAGKKPLFTYWDGKTFAFASEIKALFEMGKLNFSMSSDKLKESLVYGYVPWPHTIYRHIRKLPAGHFQRIDFATGPQAVQQYWELPIGETDYSISEKDATQKLKFLLGKAVEKRLISDVPVACFLSGGLDSSAITLEASRLISPVDLRTFSAGFTFDSNSKMYDESSYAVSVANQIGTHHTSLQVDALNVDADSIMRRFDEPFGDSSAIPTYLLCEQTSRFVKVVLSGDGGDELFGGYYRFRGGLLSEKFKSLWQWALSPVTLLNPHPRSLLGKIKRFRSAVSQPLLKRIAIWNSFFSESELESFLGESTESVFESLKVWDKRTEGLTIGEKILHYNFKTYLFDDLLPKVDRMSMAHGLEVRSPFLDKELIEFAFRLPTAFKFNIFQTKIILKNAYRSELTASITDRAKHGFAFPLETFLGSKNSESEMKTKGIHRFFPKAVAAQAAIEPMNRFSKNFMLFSLEQCLKQTSTRFENAV